MDLVKTINCTLGKRYIKKKEREIINEQLNKIKDTLDEEKEIKVIDTVIEVMDKQDIKADDKKIMITMLPKMNKIIKKYEEEYEENDNEDEINNKKTPEEIEEILDDKIDKYNKYTKNHPMKGVTFDNKTKKYQIKYNNIRTHSKSLYDACEKIINNELQTNDRLKNMICIPNKKLKKIYHEEEEIRIIEYIYNDIQLYDILHVIENLCYKKSHAHDKYKEYQEHLKYFLICKNIYGGFFIREFVTRDIVKKILAKSIRPNAINIAKIINMNFHDTVYATKEASTINKILKVFSKEEYELQKNVGKYRIDLYFPDYNLAVECDEFGHTMRNKKYENERQKYIERKLGSTFIRYNPDKSNFDILYVISEIFYHIQKCNSSN